MPVVMCSTVAADGRHVQPDDVPTISMACVTRNVMKIGSSTMIDSLMPRRLSRISSRMPANSTPSLDCWCVKLQNVPIAAQQSEQGVAGGRDRDRDRQRIVDQQRTARHHADARAQQLRGHQVSAAAGGKLFDDVAVAGRDDEHGDGRGQGQKDRQVA